jgi:uncharacterized protein YcbX
MAARVVRISVAPIKALGLSHPDEVELGPLGAAGNRRFWLRETSGRHVSNTKHGPLVGILPEWDEETRELALTFPDGRRVSGTVELGDEAVGAQIRGRAIPSRHVVGPWASAISEFAGEPVELLWSRDGVPDRLDNGTTTLVSRESIARLAHVAGERSLDGRRFRMLFEIEGVDAHEEDGWIGRHVRVGGATLQVNGDVGRCAVTTHDPDTGVPTVDTLKALAAYRRDGRTEPLPLGVYGSVVVPGHVRVGDAVEPMPALVSAAS